MLRFGSVVKKAGISFLRAAKQRSELVADFLGNLGEVRTAIANEEYPTLTVQELADMGYSESVQKNGPAGLFNTPATVLNRGLVFRWVRSDVGGAEAFSLVEVRDATDEEKAKAKEAKEKAKAYAKAHKAVQE